MENSVCDVSAARMGSSCLEQSFLVVCGLSQGSWCSHCCLPCGSGVGTQCIQAFVQFAILCGYISISVVTCRVHCLLIKVGGLGNLTHPFGRLQSLQALDLCVQVWQLLPRCQRPPEDCRPASRLCRAWSTWLQAHAAGLHCPLRRPPAAEVHPFWVSAAPHHHSSGKPHSLLCTCF